MAPCPPLLHCHRRQCHAQPQSRVTSDEFEPLLVAKRDLPSNLRPGSNSRLPSTRIGRCFLHTESFWKVNSLLKVSFGSYFWRTDTNGE